MAALLCSNKLIVGSAAQVPTDRRDAKRKKPNKTKETKIKRVSERDTTCRYCESTTSQLVWLETGDWSKRSSSQSKCELQFAHFGNWTECNAFTSFDTHLPTSQSISLFSTNIGSNEVDALWRHRRKKFAIFWSIRWSNGLETHRMMWPTSRITSNSFPWKMEPFDVGIGVCVCVCPTIIEIISFHVPFRLHLRNFVEQCTFPLIKFRFCFEWMWHISVSWMECVVAVVIVVVVCDGGSGSDGSNGGGDVVRWSLAPLWSLDDALFRQSTCHITPYHTTTRTQMLLFNIWPNTGAHAASFGILETNSIQWNSENVKNEASTTTAQMTGRERERSEKK